MAADDQPAQRYGKAFPKGSVLFQEGDAGHEMFVIRSGEVAISKKVRDIEKQLSTLGPGEFFGEMSLLTNKPRSATATLLTDGQLLIIDPKTFEGMLRGNGEIAVRMIRKLADRLAEADAQIETLLLRDPASRVVHYLTHAAEVRGQPNGDGVLVPLQIGDLPSVLGLSPEQVKEVLQQLTRAGVATFQVDQVHVSSLDKLKEFRASLEMRARAGDRPGAAV
jgi:CRP/FNR family transcriptional regulator, cyclic AMP receptor protein